MQKPERLKKLFLTAETAFVVLHLLLSNSQPARGQDVNPEQYPFTTFLPDVRTALAARERGDAFLQQFIEAGNRLNISTEQYTWEIIGDYPIEQAVYGLNAMKVQMSLWSRLYESAGTEFGKLIQDQVHVVFDPAAINLGEIRFRFNESTGKRTVLITFGQSDPKNPEWNSDLELVVANEIISYLTSRPDRENQPVNYDLPGNQTRAIDEFLSNCASFAVAQDRLDQGDISRQQWEKLVELLTNNQSRTTFTSNTSNGEVYTLASVTSRTTGFYERASERLAEMMSLELSGGIDPAKIRQFRDMIVAFVTDTHTGYRVPNFDETGEMIRTVIRNFIEKNELSGSVPRLGKHVGIEAAYSSHYKQVLIFAYRANLVDLGNNQFTPTTSPFRVLSVYVDGKQLPMIAENTEDYFTSKSTFYTESGNYAGKTAIVTYSLNDDGSNPQILLVRLVDLAANSGTDEVNAQELDTTTLNRKNNLPIIFSGRATEAAARPPRNPAFQKR